jgi:putative ABC transport system ATP-binding protein/lipoprotein-releasing system ATP-binding protein
VLSPVVRAEGLGHWFIEGHTLFKDLNFELVPDHVYGVVGPSGSGKSTLLSILAGWLAPQEGSVTREGIDTIRWVFQNPHGVASRTVRDHVSLGYLAQGMTRADADEAAEELLAQFGLDALADALFSSLSGGEAQRLMLARGIASAPSLFLVDEPTAQLDRGTAAEVNATLTALAGKGVIVVIATHDHDTRDACTDLIDLDVALV